MKFEPARLKGAFIVEIEPSNDMRGWFARYYCKKEFKAIGHEKEWVQMNHSFTRDKGTIRGMHFQLPPFREIKMVKCVSGSIFDVIIDLRKDSPSFLQWTSVELSDRNNQLLYIPEGFAHGFQSLEDNCTVLYHHSEYFTPGAESGIRYDDPMLRIDWPLPVSMISDRDKNHPEIGNDFNGL